MIRILHCADVHIDTVFANVSSKESNERRASLVSAFSKTVESARLAGIQLFLIAGDLFNCETVSFDTVATLSRDMKSYPECKFVIACGNHDPYIEKGAYDSTLWPENCYIFKSSEVTKFSFDDINTDVYGYSFTSGAMRECPLENFEPDDKTRINIVLAHGDLDAGISNYCPIRSKLLESLDVDYIALGHIHKGANSYAGEKYAYSGCLSGRALDETGKKGYIAGELDKGNRNLHFVNSEGRHYEKDCLDVSGYAEVKSLLNGIENTVSQYDKNTVLRLTLSGELSNSIERIPDIGFAEKYVEKLEIRDETTEQIDFSELVSDKSIKGVCARKLMPYLQSDDVNERKKGILALKYLTSALKGEKNFE